LTAHDNQHALAQAILKIYLTQVYEIAGVPTSGINRKMIAAIREAVVLATKWVSADSQPEMEQTP
jgi:hypothetical protein